MSITLSSIYTDIYDIQLGFPKFLRSNNNWMEDCIWPVGRSLDSLGIEQVNIVDVSDLFYNDLAWFCEQSSHDK